VSVSRGKQRETASLSLLDLADHRRSSERVFLRNVSIIYYQQNNPQVKAWKSVVQIWEQEKVVQQGIIQVNHPLAYRGFEFFQSSYFVDETNKRICSGLRVVKDPGVIWVYTGFLLLSLSLLLKLCNGA
jgi:cytochrome c biogenesis protein ResB